MHPKNLNSFVNYARRQASKYGIKGSRLNAALQVLTILKSNKAVSKIASEAELKRWLDPSNYIGTSPIQVTNLVQRIQKFLQSREKK